MSEILPGYLWIFNFYAQEMKQLISSLNNNNNIPDIKYLSILPLYFNLKAPDYVNYIVVEHITVKVVFVSL